MPPALRIPITNVHGMGDYTAQIKVGSAGIPANVLLDTGSSTLAINSTVYNPGTDAKMEPTSLAQDIIYDTGGWTGPVIKADVAIGSDGQALSINTYLAVTADSAPGNFGDADGVIGLAFNWLNSAYDLSSHFAELKLPAVTYPWPFRLQGSKVALRQFAKFLSRLPKQDLKPYFSVLTDADVAKDIFAFYTHRSTVTKRTADPASDSLNNGLFILGGGPEQDDLYTGDFADVGVVDDMWYNVNLLSVQVASCPQVDAKKLTMQDAKTNISNSIIDSGASAMVLAPDVYTAIMSSLHDVNPALTDTVKEAQQHVIPANSLNLDDWPDITFILAGKDGGPPVPLTCAASNYWQLDTPGAGQATFQISNSNGAQSILGLPLLNSYYTVFDRQSNPYGVVRFAKIAPPP